MVEPGVPVRSLAEGAVRAEEPCAGSGMRLLAGLGTAAVVGLDMRGQSLAE